jgi:subtilisin family serine protease
MRPNPFHSKPSLLIAATALAFATAPLAATTAAPADPPASGSTPPTASDKIKVTTADDLPRHTYAISGKTLDILNDPAKFDPIVDKLIADALRDLETYDISDPTTLQAYYELLSQAYTLRMDLPRALEWSNRAGTLDDKPQERATRGNILGALAAAREVSTDMSSPQFIAKFKQSLKERVSAQPYDLVKDQLIGMRSQAKMITRELVESSLSGQLDTLIAAANGQATAGIAESIMGAKITLDIALPLLPHIASVYGEIIDANANAVKASSKWDTRLVELEPSSSATPVVLGVWDSGVDVGLYTKQLWQNPAESPNGLDDDRNGFVDDVHGIAFGLDRLPTTGSLCSLDGLKGSKELYMDFIAASQDMQAGVQNESVTRFQEYFSALRGKDLENFSDDMGLIGSYAHGTHVAGVAVAGNPFARILHIAENWPWKSIPDEAPTIEFGERWGEACRQSVTYMKGANTRVVNMSWRIGRPMLEGMLAAKGVGATPEERAELSRRIFKPFRDGLEEAIRSAPDVLFIAGSGNEDNNVDFAEYVPAGLRLPNLITVGAVDDQDQFTSFTTTGENVELYANGFRIPSMVPGGRVIPFSGTSMAAPQVANLAAKILALRPELKPADVIALMKANADPIPNKPGRFIINPKRTIEALQAQK